MIMGKEKLIPSLTAIILIISISSTIYVYATQINKDTITLNGEEYTIDDIFFITEEKTIDTKEGEKTGADLEDLISKIGIGFPSFQVYTIKAKDGYEQTVNWDIMKTGIVDKNRKVFFPDTPKKFWVSDIVEIEVI
jgi:hypothetical protein